MRKHTQPGIPQILRSREPRRSASIKVAGHVRRRLRPCLDVLEDRVLLSVNPIVTENQLPGTSPSQWQIFGGGDTSIQGFTTDISVNHGQTVSFKVNDSSLAAYHIDIYRMGYYGGNGRPLGDDHPRRPDAGRDAARPFEQFRDRSGRRRQLVRDGFLGGPGECDFGNLLRRPDTQ